jgi:DNA-binding protein HU-beta
MTKKDLIAEVARRTGLTRDQVLSSVEGAVEVISEQLCKGETVSLRGFGNFMVKQRKGKVARNIATNTQMKLPPTQVPHFKPADQLIDKVKSKNTNS